MHAALVHLSPILAAEKNKVPFYIGGGVLVVWALFVSFGIGMRNPSFPSTLGAQRAVMAITAALVLVAASLAVITSGGSSEKATAETVAKEGGSGQGGSERAPAPESAGTGVRSSGGRGAAQGGHAGGSSSTTGQAPAPAAGTGSASTTLQEAADPSGQLSFASKALSAKAGTVTVDFTNASPLPHNLTIAQGTKVLGATPTFQGGSKKLALKLAPGTYVFYCSVPGHRQAGMEGKLTVQ